MCLESMLPVPRGRWGVAVSGGADSVALLLLLMAREDLSLHVIHLDHQTRGQESAGDAQFVKNLAHKLKIPCTTALRTELELELSQLPKNKSARYRALRLAIFHRVVEKENLLGVIVAHHADDLIETVLLRMLRGSGPAGLSGMSPTKRIQGLTILRPLLNVRRENLRDFLVAQKQPWREDASNQSDVYARNRIRKWLATHPKTHEPLLEFAFACGEIKRWTRESAPNFSEQFPATELANLPRMLARESARRWLISAGCTREDLTPGVLDRLRAMATDAASAPRQQFPGNITVRRRGGKIFKQLLKP